MCKLERGKGVLSVLKRSAGRVSGLVVVNLKWSCIVRSHTFYF